MHAPVAKIAAGVNITTVYRTLELLEELGLVTHTHLSHGAPTYHAAGEDQHVHLVCRACGAVDEIDPEVLAPLAEQLRGERGFRVDIGHVALFGLCGDCGEAGMIDIAARCRRRRGRLDRRSRADAGRRRALRRPAARAARCSTPRSGWSTAATAA